jgi:SAM-dependent methyltransferase
MRRRSNISKSIDFFSFPIRAITLFEKDFYCLSSLQSERYDYVAREVVGKCLDIGCGRYNRFINEYLGGKGVGIDVFLYEGLNKKQIIKDMTHLPYKPGVFDTVTLIANINHIPESIRYKELKEITRVLKKNGRLIVTMGNPISETIVHRVVLFYEKFFNYKIDVDSQRGMEHDEAYYLSDEEIKRLLALSGFKIEKRITFWTQWGFNHLFVASKNRK